MHLAHSATTPPRLSLAEAQADGVEGGGACGDSVAGRGQGEIGGDSDARADWGVVSADPGTGGQRSLTLEASSPQLRTQWCEALQCISGR